MEDALKSLFSIDSPCRRLILSENSNIYSSLLSLTTGSILWCHSRKCKLKEWRSKRVTFKCYDASDFSIVGQTYDGLILSGVRFAVSSGRPVANLIAQSIECVRSGGFAAIVSHRSQSSLFLKRLERIALDKTGSCVVLSSGEIGVQLDPLVPVVKGAAKKEQAKFVSIIRSHLTAGEVCFIGGGRGRGKSALLGIIVGEMASEGCGLIGLSGPSASSLRTVVTFISKTLEKHNVQFELSKSANGEFRRITLPSTVIEFIHPLDSSIRCDILVIDEAACIASTRLHSLTALVPRLLIATTTDGYEGTGNAFSLRFLDRLERPVHRFCLDQPIRYAKNDPIERWLNIALLCDGEMVEKDERISSYPIPSQLSLCRLNQKALFNGNNDNLLNSVVQLFIQAHYRHSPNDIELMADLHHLFVLINLQTLEVFSALQVAIETNEQSNNGNLIPSVLRNQYPNETKWLQGSKGLRIVRIATKLNAQSLGYGRELVKRVIEFYTL